MIRPHSRHIFFNLFIPRTGLVMAAQFVVEASYTGRHGRSHEPRPNSTPQRRRNASLHCELSNLFRCATSRHGCCNDTQLPSVQLHSVLTHFCSAARCSPGADLDMKISGTGLVTLTNPHSSVSGRILVDIELMIVMLSASSLCIEAGECGTEATFFGCTNSKSIPPALTVSS